MATVGKYTLGSTVAARGVRKINEDTVQEGRALIITENDENNYDWEEIPDGSLKVDINNGIILVKLSGQSTWVPSNVRIDVPRDTEGNVIYDTNNSEYGHTISIAKDAIVLRENFTITNLNVDGGTKFYYEDETGQRWTGEKSSRGYHFELHKGHYAVGRNMLDIVIDDCLYRSAASGGVIEQSESRFIVTEELVEGMELTVKYYQLVRIGNPYPRIFLRRGEYGVDGVDTNGEPEAAEVGDVWIDFSGNPEADDGYLGEVLGGSDMVPWSRITGYPSTVLDAKSCGLMTDAEVKGHRHSISDISGLNEAISGATSKVANASYADRAGNASNADNANRLQNHAIGTNSGDIVQVQQSGKIASSLMPNHTHTASQLYMDDGKTLVQGVVDYVSTMFPRGIIVPFWGNTVPNGWAECNGDNGTPDLRDRFVMGAGGSYGQGTVLDESVPNIRGAFKIWKFAETDGSFFVNGSWGEAQTRDGGNDPTYRIEFDASRSNAAYGRNGGKVLPKTYVLRYIMKL